MTLSKVSGYIFLFSTFLSIPSLGFYEFDFTTCLESSENSVEFTCKEQLFEYSKDLAISLTYDCENYRDNDEKAQSFLLILYSINKKSASTEDVFENKVGSLENNRIQNAINNLRRARAKATDTCDLSH